MSLAAYRMKRNFRKTPEPPARAHRRGKELIFVVQKHHASQIHHDFRLELDRVLKSWAVPKGPPRRSADKRLAVQVEDNPYAYKDFEGRIPEGEYGAGAVEKWDGGTYAAEGARNAAESEHAMRAGMRRGRISFVLHGSRLRGPYSLVRLKSPKQWLLIKSMRKNDLKPMLATLIDAPFDDKDWVFETKWDGFRLVAKIGNGDASLSFPKIISGHNGGAVRTRLGSR
jgi:bifunctional non-homologous end joining protein LigD